MRRLVLLSAAVLSVGDVQWQLTQGTHTMRSTSDAGEPTFIFSSVVDRDPDTFFCVILKRGTHWRNHAQMQPYCASLPCLACSLLADGARQWQEKAGATAMATWWEREGKCLRWCVGGPQGNAMVPTLLHTLAGVVI